MYRKVSARAAAYNHKGNQFPRLSFAHLPTRIEPLPALGASLGGPGLYVKRDDCTGLAGGGNKTRKLEFIMADALERGADTVITLGGIQSNHVRQTAAISAKLGLRCHAIVHNPIGTEDAAYLQSGNVLLDRLLGAVIHRVPPETSPADVVTEVAEELKRLGQNPYIIPLGGSNALGSLGYVACAREILDQAGYLKIDFDWVVLPGGSAGTQAGLVVGFMLAHADTRVLSISIWEPENRLRQTAFDLVKATCDCLGEPCPLAADDLFIDDDYIGPGYGYPTDGGLEAIRLTAQTEGILLDPVYTGKTMAGLMALIKKGFFKPTDNILFLHTGGSQALYGYVNRFKPGAGEEDR